jgi:hypothetical protein
MDSETLKRRKVYTAFYPREDQYDNLIFLKQTTKRSMGSFIREGIDLLLDSEGTPVAVREIDDDA